MSCSGCRVLRKGCSESCVLRNSIGFIEPPDSQGYATLFVAKFFGRAGMISSLSSVPDSRRPALFRSLLYEACGRTVNPVTGSVGLLWSGKWDVCEAAVETVLRGGALRAADGCGYGDGLYGLGIDRERLMAWEDLDLSLRMKGRMMSGGGAANSDESGMTSEGSSSLCGDHKRPQLLNLFV